MGFNSGFKGLKVCTEFWNDRVATVLPGRQAAGSYKALVPIYQTTSRHTHADCNLHLKIVKTSVLATHFGFPIHKQNCTSFQSTFPFYNTFHTNQFTRT